MKKFWEKAESNRWKDAPHGLDSVTGERGGVFRIPGPCGMQLHVIVSDAMPPEYPWEHVSVSTRNRCPNWPEMDFIKRLFWDDDECVMQLHPPRSDHVNCHPHCLHLWRPVNAEIPRPPSILVGPDEFKDKG